MFSHKITRFIAAGAAAIVVAIGAYAIGDASSGNSPSGSANAAAFARSSPNQRAVGRIPQNWRPGTGTIVTGAAADRAKAVALARYPGGTANRVLKFGDGSYAVHMIKISWPHHVFVTKNFKVTGAIG
jgi:hypothetical protein